MNIDNQRATLADVLRAAVKKLERIPERSCERRFKVADSAGVEVEQ